MFANYNIDNLTKSTHKNNPFDRFSVACLRMEKDFVNALNTMHLTNDRLHCILSYGIMSLDVSIIKILSVFDFDYRTILKIVATICCQSYDIHMRNNSQNGKEPNVCVIYGYRELWATLRSIYEWSIMYIANNFKILKFIIGIEKNITRVNIDFDFNFLFCESCKHGNIDIAKYLYSSGNIDINPLYMHLFLECCHKSQLSILKWLYSLGINCDGTVNPQLITNPYLISNLRLLIAIRYINEDITSWLVSIGMITDDMANEYYATTYSH